MGVRWGRWGPHEIKVGRGLTWKNNNISLEWVCENPTPNFWD